eukprot:NODE_2588_length_1083_cov_200.700193_g2151_i0.p1 GENE.NODE_2588_length_1083_cov_200.700193_g2151_i0~~NODE_2588_length_1083_cov_200.700193_g2151_i0.p1  ORF type:complete len:310 (-),score=73.16 NODE_2588_length_1083_cov_200.700193_g2151_i0:57-986(-)
MPKAFEEMTEEEQLVALQGPLRRLQAMSPEERNQALGKPLHAQIKEHRQQLAGSAGAITGILLEIDDFELLRTLNDRSLLVKRADAAFKAKMSKQSVDLAGSAAPTKKAPAAKPSAKAAARNPPSAPPASSPASSGGDFLRQQQQMPAAPNFFAQQQQPQYQGQQAYVPPGQQQYGQQQGYFDQQQGQQQQWLVFMKVVILGSFLSPSSCRGQQQQYGSQQGCGYPRLSCPESGPLCLPPQVTNNRPMASRVATRSSNSSFTTSSKGNNSLAKAAVVVAALLRAVAVVVNSNIRSSSTPISSRRIHVGT